MNRDKLKWGIVLFCILLLGFLVGNSLWTRLFCSILLIVGDFSIINIVSREKKNRPYYGVAFFLSLVSALLLNFTLNILYVYGLVLISVVSGLLALYRSNYHYTLSMRAAGQICDDFTYLVFSEADCFFISAVQTNEEREKKTIIRIAGGIALIVLTVTAVLFCWADGGFSFFLQALLKLLWDNTIKIIICVVLGVFLGIFIFSFLWGIIQGNVEQNPNWFFKHADDKKADYKASPIVCFYYNVKSVTWSLNSIILCNLLFIILQIGFYWRLINEAQKVIDQIKNQWSYIIILLCVYLETMVLWGAHKYRQIIERDNAICNRRLIEGSVTCLVVLFLNIGRFALKMYYTGIKSQDVLPLYFIISLIFFVVSLLLLQFKKIGEQEKVHFSKLLVILIFITVVWNKNVFPLYNTNIFLFKYAKGQVENYNLKEEEIAISQKDIDILCMSKSGIFAVPPLIKLLDMKNRYEPTNLSISETAILEIASIFRDEMKTDDVRQMDQAQGLDKVSVIIENIEIKPEYSMGIRAYCLQLMQEYVNSFETN